jgi:hypothetical protein
MKIRIFQPLYNVIALLSLALLCPSSLHAQANPPNPSTPLPITLVTESFGGSGGALNGTTADTYAAGITAAGGINNWYAGNNIFDNGGVNPTAANVNQSAFLLLGNYINTARGTAAGMFDLTMDISSVPAGSWISLGFLTNSTIGASTTNSNFSALSGAATVVYRSQANVIPGEFDMYGYKNNVGLLDGPNNNSGTRTLTVRLDFTPAGGYNGSDNFGSVYYYDSVLGNLGGLGDSNRLSYTYLVNTHIGAIEISQAGIASGTIDNLILTQIPEPCTAVLLGLGGLGLILRRRRSYMGAGQNS